MVILADTLGVLIALLFAAFVVLDPVGILSVAIGLTQWLVLHLWIIYTLWFHPLSRIPGPKIWIISRIPYARTLRNGDFASTVRSFHNRYGPVVRLAFDEVSFIDAQAWTDIYGLHPGGKFPKNPIWLRQAINGAHSIISAPEADHARFRRILSNAFTDQTLKEQAPIIDSYVDLLISQLREKAASGTSVDFERLLYLHCIRYYGRIELRRILPLS